MDLQIKTKMDIKDSLIGSEDWDGKAKCKQIKIRCRTSILNKLKEKINSKDLVIVSLLTIAISSTAFAGPDWEIIHMAEEHKLSSEHAEQSNIMQKALVVLDHGSGAITTPYMNKERKLKLKQIGGPQNSDSAVGVELAQPDAIDVAK